MRRSLRALDIDDPEFDERLVVRLLLIAFSVIALVGTLLSAQ